MTINRDIWSGLFPRNAMPGFPCPACVNGKLKLVKGSLEVSEPAYSVNERQRNSHDWAPEMDVSRWSARLKCDEDLCGEIVSVHGDTYWIDDDSEDDEGIPQWSLAEMFRIRGIYPAPPMFPVSKNVPHEVVFELRTAFKLFWVDKSACVARLRTAVERLLDDQSVPKHATAGGGNVKRLDLHSRINLFASGAAHADQMHGLRNIGNLGTHGSQDVTPEDLFDALDVLQYVLTGIYDTMTIDAKANRLKARRHGN